MAERCLGVVTAGLFPFALFFAPAAPALTFSAQEASVIQRLQSQMEPGVPYELDVTDEGHHAYVQAMLRASGLNAGRRPQLFAVIEKLRTAKRGRGLRPARGFEDAMLGASGMASQSDGDSPFSPINVISYIDNNDNRTVTSSLLSSIPGGTQSTQMMVNYRMEKSDQPFASSPPYGQYHQGTQFEQDYSANMPEAGVVIASALFVTTVGGIPTMTTTWRADGPPNAIDQCVTAPNYTLWQTPPIKCPPVGSACINKGSVTTKIIQCYGRSSQSPPCNYSWGGSGYPTSVLISVAGTMTWPARVHQPITGSYSLILQRQNQGGCVLQGPQSAGPFPTANFSVDPNNPTVLRYCFTSAAFPSNACMHNPTVDMYLNLNVTVQLDHSGPGSNFGTATVSGNASINPHQPYFALIPSINVLQGCVASGTKVTMANGKTKPIEKIRGDGSESVLVHPDGQRIAVQGLADGTEERPMIRITDSMANSLLVSETHPIVVREGVLIPAADLEVGSPLVTLKGPSTVTKIEREQYGGKVWNLTYGPLERHGIARSTFFANGILVGNMAAQQEMRTAVRRRRGLSKEDVLAALPKEWHQDYLNWLAEQSQQH